MKDPFPIPPPVWLVEKVQPLANSLGLPTLALHAHEVLFAFILYTSIGSVVSPILSTWLVPQKYKALNHRTKVNWDVHVVSFFQSVLISAMSLYVIFYDEERIAVRPRDQWEGRVWEYTGLSGLCQSFALGYFLWDFIQCSYHVEIFGLGMLAHAISAVSVFALGYVSPLSTSCSLRSILSREASSIDLIDQPELISTAATIHLLLRPGLPPLRALVTFPQHPLVLRQAQLDWKPHSGH